MRPEIQALRAIAVALVVLYHFWPWKLPGGFVGVDVFFVISGFLITSHLLRDVAKTGRVSLASFWARRARRLLPASLLVLLATSVGVLVLMPSSRWRDIFSEIVASTLYVQNWFLASTATDYSAADATASPVQHYWSLSAEEQFYLVWPILIAIIAAVVGLWAVRSRAAARDAARAERVRTRAIVIGLGVVVAASFVWSVYATAISPDSAYFITPTRAWEFGAGGLLAAVLPRPIPATTATRASLLAGLSLAGLAALAIAALAYNTDTPFPGYAALLPVLGTLAIIAAGSPRAWFSPARVAGLAPVQFLGDISYSVYLWHWPLLMLAPYLLSDTGDRGLGAVAKALLILLAVLLAWVTKIVVEDPARSARFLTARRPRFTLAAAAAGMVLVMVVPVVTIVQADETERRSAELLAQLLATPKPVDGASSLDSVRDAVLASLPECLGALERTATGDCTNPALENDPTGSKQGVVLPDPSAGIIKSYRSGCLDSDIKKFHHRICEAGTPADQATKTVAIIGDSHAFSLLPAIRAIAEAASWHIVVITRGSCPFSLGTRGLADDGERAACTDWNAYARSVLEDRPEISAVFTSASAKNEYFGTDGRSGYDSGVAGATDLWRELPSTVSDVVVVRDVPRARQDVVECLDEEFGADSLDDSSCSSPESAVTFADPLAEAAADWTPHTGDPRVTLVDPSDIFCRDGECAAYMGHTLVYRDTHHLAPVFARTLAPFIVSLLPADGFGPGK